MRKIYRINIPLYTSYDIQSILQKGGLSDMQTSELRMILAENQKIINKIKNPDKREDRRSANEDEAERIRNMLEENAKISDNFNDLVNLIIAMHKKFNDDLNELWNRFKLCQIRERKDVEKNLASEESAREVRDARDIFFSGITERERQKYIIDYEKTPYVETAAEKQQNEHILEQSLRSRDISLNKRRDKSGAELARLRAEIARENQQLIVLRAQQRQAIADRNQDRANSVNGQIQKMEQKIGINKDKLAAATENETAANAELGEAKTRLAQVEHGATQTAGFYQSGGLNEEQKKDLQNLVDEQKKLMDRTKKGPNIAGVNIDKLKADQKGLMDNFEKLVNFFLASHRKFNGALGDLNLKLEECQNKNILRLVNQSNFAVEDSKREVESLDVLLGTSDGKTLHIEATHESGTGSPPIDIEVESLPPTPTEAESEPPTPSVLSRQPTSSTGLAAPPVLPEEPILATAAVTPPTAPPAPIEPVYAAATVSAPQPHAQPSATTTATVTAPSSNGPITPSNNKKENSINLKKLVKSAFDVRGTIKDNSEIHDIPAINNLNTFTEKLKPANLDLPELGVEIPGEGEFTENVANLVSKFPGTEHWILLLGRLNSYVNASLSQSGGGDKKIIKKYTILF